MTRTNDVAAGIEAAEAAYRAGDHKAADAAARAVLLADPGHARAIGLRGFIAAGAGEIERAIALLVRACAIEEEPVRLAALGSLHRRQFDLEAARSTGQRAVALATGKARLAPLLELARTEIDRGEFDDAAPDQAADCFLAALRIDPDNADAHYGLATVLLAGGDFAAGWREYEWRNRLPAAAGRNADLALPHWNGMDLPRGRLLVMGDQGHGDAMQFARFLPAIARRVGSLVVACSPELRALLGRVDGVERACDRWDEIPSFTTHVQFASLPGLCGVTADAVPAPVPYLAPDPERRDFWAARLATFGAAPVRRIGIAWSGRQTHPNDRRRSLDLARLARVLDALGSDVAVSLQKDRTEADRATLARAGVHDLADALTDFSETAAIVANLDLLITVDTAVAHLAGGLGVPVWLLLPSPADWRWLRRRTCSPWYPQMRLFRQPTPGDWDGAIAELVIGLADFTPQGRSAGR